MGHLRFAICDLRLFGRGRRAVSSPSRPRGFTLIELMVVIFIIVLGMTLAIPAIRALTGSRSLEATENSLSTYVNFARTEAIGFQRTEGVMFLLDTGADRVKCAIVMDTGLQFTTDLSGVTYLDLVPDHDPISLPAGVRVWTMKDMPPPPLVLAEQGMSLPGNAMPTDPFQGCRYLGFNPNPSNPSTPSYGLSNNVNGYPISAVPGGVILFDKNGHLTTPRYGLRLNQNSLLGQLVSPGAAQAGPTNLLDWPSQNNAPGMYITAQTGMVVFDRETFLAQTDPSSQKQFTEANDTSSPNSTLEKAMENWLDYGDVQGNGGGGTGGALFVFVNRYDGNLIPAE